MDKRAASSASQSLLHRDKCVLDELLEDGSMVLFHTGRRQLMTLNPTAAFVWEHCDGTHTQAAIEVALRAVFPDASSVGDDVTTVLRDLESHGMLAVPD